MRHLKTLSDFFKKEKYFGEWFNPAHLFRTQEFEKNNKSPKLSTLLYTRPWYFYVDVIARIVQGAHCVFSILGAFLF